MPIIRVNREATFKYAIHEKLEAGLELQGWEVKSIKQGGVALRGSFVRPLGDELYWVNGQITPIDTSREEQEVTRSRRLLLHRHQIKDLTQAMKKGGFTVVPLRIYTTRNLIKMEIGLAKGKKRFEQALTKKKKSQERRLKQDIKEAGY